MTLHIAPDLDLPDDFATQGVAIIGVRGSGKSNTEVRYAELLHGAGIPFVAVDPKGDWYGVRMEGTGPGLPIPVFGGLYGDFPLDDHTGARIADLLVDENLSAVLDVSRLSKTVGLPRFLTEFCNRLMDRHQEEPHVRSVILEEAHRYIPQQVKGGPAAALKEAAASLLLEGRAFGLGCWACTQRPARLHNDVLEEVDTAVIHRIGVTATADLKRVRDWVKHEELGPEVSESLTKLATGEAWVLSPIALGIIQRVQIDRRTTFDSGATPVVGAKRREMATMATIDAGAIKEALADVVEKADATDPKKLAARIRDLERELAQRPDAEVVVEHVRVPYIPDEVRKAVGVFMESIRLGVLEHVANLHAVMEQYPDGGDLPTDRAGATEPTTARSKPTPTAPARKPAAPVARPAGGDGGLKGAERKFLMVLAQHGPQERARLAILAGYSVKSRHVDNTLGALRGQGYVTTGWPATITDEGLDALGHYDPLPSGAELRDYWLGHSKVTGAMAAFLAVLIDRYPDTITRDELAEATNYSTTSRHVDNTLGALRGLGLAVGGRDGIAASDTLFVGP